MTAFQWVQIAWMVGVGVLLLVFRSGLFVGTKAERLQRMESQGEAKADAKALASTEQRLADRIDYLDRRLTDLVARTEKRFDDGSERMSALNSKFMVMVDTIHNEVMLVRERVARVEGGNGNGKR